MGLSDLFKGKGKSEYQVSAELLNHPLKDKYFYRLMPYTRLDAWHIAAYDSAYPRMITFDDWPQNVFLAATGTKTLHQFTLEMAKAYNGRVPQGLESTIIEELEKMVREKMIAISDEIVMLPQKLLDPMEKTLKL